MQNLKSKFIIRISSKTFYFLLIFLTFEFLFLNLGKVDASALSLSIDPSIIEINAIPPTDITSSLNIQNNGDTQVTLQIQIKPFKAAGENGELIYSKEFPEIFKDIQILDDNLPVERLTLNPKQQKNLKLNIHIAQDTNISDYYFSVIFVSTNFSPVKSNSSLNQIGIATNVLLSVGPLETPKVTIEEFSTNIFSEGGPVPFTVRIKNEGSHFLKSEGEIIIKNMFGQNIGKLDLTRVNILADSIRAIPNDAYFQKSKLNSDSGTQGKFPVDFKHPIALWNEGFLLGLYTATLNISLSNEGSTFTRTIHFFAFPFQGLILIVILLMSVIIIRNRLKLYMTHR